MITNLSSAELAKRVVMVISFPHIRALVEYLMLFRIQFLNFSIKHIYSRLSLSRTRLFLITAYLEVKVWSLF